MNNIAENFEFLKKLDLHSQLILFFRETFIIPGRLVSDGGAAASARRSRPTSTLKDTG